MTISSIDTIMGRVEEATRESPIAVFVETDGEKLRLNAAFASTVATQERIKRDAGSLVGVFDKRLNPKTVRSALRIATTK